METKKIVMGVISVAVAIIVLMSMIPIFTDAGASEDTFSNVEGSQSYMTKIGTDTESYTLVIDGENNPGYVTVNGVDIRPNPGTLFCIDGFGLIRNHTGYTDDRFSAVRLEFGNSLGSTNYVNLSIVNGVCTYIYGTQTTPATIDISAGGFGIIDKGNYVMTNADQHKYLNSDSEIYGQGLTTVTGGAWNTQLVVKGTIEDGITVTNIYPPAQADTVFSDITIVNTEVSGHEDLYDMEKITFVATYSTNDPTDCTYNRVIIPAEVTAERSVHASPVEATLIGLIPLLMMVGIMLTAIGLFIAKYRKN